MIASSAVPAAEHASHAMILVHSSLRERGQHDGVLIEALALPFVDCHHLNATQLVFASVGAQLLPDHLIEQGQKVQGA